MKETNLPTSLPDYKTQTPKSSATNPNTATSRKRKQSPQSCQAQHLHTWFSARDPNSPNTHSLSSLPSSGIAAVALITSVQK